MAKVDAFCANLLAQKSMTAGARFAPLRFPTAELAGEGPSRRVLASGCFSIKQHSAGGRCDRGLGLSSRWLP
jgi:hypothetical protein